MEKIDQMCSRFTSAELTRFHAVKHAFDAKGLLDPAKAVPTLARRAGYNAMRVHRGQSPFPERERF